MDDDHLDIYGSREKLIKGFESFIAQVADKGKVIIKKEVPLDVPANLRVFTYSMEDPDADYSLQALSLQERAYLMTVKTPKNIFEATLGIPGKVNVENALAAIAVADQLGVPLEGISKACTTFRGVKRRFDVQVNRDDRIYIDDYAHHPEEIRAFIESVRSIYPDKRITGIFQPHLYSRTRDFATGFAESLSLLDELVLLDIYPAREEPIAGVTSEMIFQNVDLREKVLISNDLLMKVMEERDPELLLTMGAGDIDRLVEPLKSWMEQR